MSGVLTDRKFATMVRLVPQGAGIKEIRTLKGCVSPRFWEVRSVRLP